MFELALLDKFATVKSFMTLTRLKVCNECYHMILMFTPLRK